jgi:hypothetical protein
MDIKDKLFFFCGLLVLVGCAPRPARTGTAGEAAGKTHIEDISAYRPSHALPEAGPGSSAGAPITPVKPTNHVNERVNVLMDSIASQNKAIKYAQGYRIMAYTGTDRKAAMDIRRAIIQRVPEQRDYLIYQQPSYRLKIGDYYNRVEAQQTMLLLRDIIPNALIVQDQINIR